MQDEFEFLSSCNLLSLLFYAQYCFGLYASLVNPRIKQQFTLELKNSQSRSHRPLCEHFPLMNFDDDLNFQT